MQLSFYKRMILILLRLELELHEYVTYIMARDYLDVIRKWEEMNNWTKISRVALKLSP